MYLDYYINNKDLICCNSSVRLIQIWEYVFENSLIFFKRHRETRLKKYVCVVRKLIMEYSF